MQTMAEGARGAMAEWTPDLADRSGPRYLAIAGALADDIQTGALPAGTRLPTHRELAWQLGVTVGTVSRAYAEATRSGLIAGEVGRGTYVRQPTAAAEAYMKTTGHAAQPGVTNLTIAYPPDVPEDRLIADAMAAVAADPNFTRFLGYQPSGGAPEHRAAGAAWLQQFGVSARPEAVALTCGAHHGILIALAAVARTGDRVLCEAMNYPGFYAICRLLGLRAEPVAMDEHGLDPDALEAAARAGDARALYTVPTLQNPTCLTMPLERRERIAAIAREYDLAIIEDDVFGVFQPDAPPPLFSLAPELGYFITSISKALAPGLRIGYLVAPTMSMDAVGKAIYASTVMPAPLMAAVTTELLISGKSERVISARRREARARMDVVRNKLAPFGVIAPQLGIHAWLPLPEGWTGMRFAEEARALGVAVTPAEAFSLKPESAPHAVRICIGPPADRVQLATGLDALTRLLGETPEPRFLSYDSMI